MRSSTGMYTADQKGAMRVKRMLVWLTSRLKNAIRGNKASFKKMLKVLGPTKEGTSSCFAWLSYGSLVQKKRTKMNKKKKKKKK